MSLIRTKKRDIMQKEVSGTRVFDGTKLFQLRELAAYREYAVVYIPIDNEDHWEFWQRHVLLLPTWWECVLEKALINPSSCTVERAFSILYQHMTESRVGSFEDYVAASTMIHFNEVWRRRDNE